MYEVGCQKWTPKPAKMAAGSLLKPAGVSSGLSSACEPYRDYSDKVLNQGLTAQRIRQDFIEVYNFDYMYQHQTICPMSQQTQKINRG
jgi:hypothetical protein